MSGFPINQDITVLPADDPAKLRLGWVIYEIPPNVTEIEYWKKHLPPEKYQEWLHESSCLRGQETEAADYFRHRNTEYKRPGELCYTNLEVLQDLWGQPWNNLALNFVHSLRPAAVRVVDANGSLTCDAFTWRVTVLLENDGRTIRKITQEVEIGGRGHRGGSMDLVAQLRYQKEHGNIEGFVQTEGGSICIINDYAISRIEIE